MAVSRDVHHIHRPVAIPGENRIMVFVYIITGVLALLAIYVVMSQAVVWANVKLDDLRYGRPRTFHLTAHVGNEQQGIVETQFIAMNLDRQVVVLEIPGGDVSQIKALNGPYLFGAGENLTPVTLHMNDVNADGTRDLVLQVKDEEVIYLYRDGGFSLISPEERQRLLMMR
jgi:hypothetical protein